MSDESYKEAWDSTEAKDWAKSVLRSTVPRIADSVLVTTFMPSDGGVGDVKLWVEIGASIFMNKPIVLVAQKGQVIPAKLELIADEIVRLDGGPTGAEAVGDAVERVIARLDEEPQ